MRVYLCGPINGMSDIEACNWRKEAKRLRPDIEWVDPMIRDYRGIEAANVEEIVCGDKADITSCDAVLRRAKPISEGSAQETMFAHMRGIRVVAWCEGSVSPWLRYHAEVHTSLIEAVMAL